MSVCGGCTIFDAIKEACRLFLEFSLNVPYDNQQAELKNLKSQFPTKKHEVLNSVCGCIYYRHRSERIIRWN